MTDLNEARQAHEAGKWDALKRLAEAATPGPWTAVDYRTYDGKSSHWYLDTKKKKADIFDEQDGTISPNHWDDARGERDMKFIAAASPAAVLDLIAENERLRQALQAIGNEIEGNTRCLIRDLVNNAAGLDNGVHPNDLYEDCDRIEGIIEAALAKGRAE